VTLNVIVNAQVANIVKNVIVACEDMSVFTLLLRLSFVSIFNAFSILCTFVVLCGSASWKMSWIVGLFSRKKSYGV